MSIIPVSALPGRNLASELGGGRWGQLGDRGGRFSQLGMRGGQRDRYVLPPGVGVATRAGRGPTHIRPQFSDGTQKHSLSQQTSFRQQLMDIINIESTVDVNQNQPLWGQATACHVYSARPPEPLRIYLPDADEPYPTPFVPTYIGRSPPVHGARAGHPNPALLRGGSLDESQLTGGSLKGGVRRCRKYTKRKCRTQAPGLNSIGRRYCARYTRRKCKRSFETGRRLRRHPRQLPGPRPGLPPGLPPRGPPPRGPPPPGPPPRPPSDHKRAPGPDVSFEEKHYRDYLMGPARPPSGADDDMGPDRHPDVDRHPFPDVSFEEKHYRDYLMGLNRVRGMGPWGHSPYLRNLSAKHFNRAGRPPAIQIPPPAARPIPPPAVRAAAPLAVPLAVPVPAALPRDYEGPGDFIPFPYFSDDDDDGDLPIWNAPVGAQIPAVVAPPIGNQPIGLGDLGVIHGSLVPDNPDNGVPAMYGNDYLPPPSAPDVLMTPADFVMSPADFEMLSSPSPRVKIKKPKKEEPVDDDDDYAGLDYKHGPNISLPARRYDDVKARLHDQKDAAYARRAADWADGDFVGSPISPGHTPIGRRYHRQPKFGVPQFAGGPARNLAEFKARYPDNHTPQTGPPPLEPATPLGPLYGPEYPGPEFGPEYPEDFVAGPGGPLAYIARSHKRRRAEARLSQPAGPLSRRVVLPRRKRYRK